MFPFAHGRLRRGRLSCCRAITRASSPTSRRRSNQGCPASFWCARLVKLMGFGNPVAYFRRPSSAWATAAWAGLGWIAETLREALSQMWGPGRAHDPPGFVSCHKLSDLIAMAGLFVAIGRHTIALTVLGSSDLMKARGLEWLWPARNAPGVSLLCYYFTCGRSSLTWCRC